MAEPEQADRTEMLVYIQQMLGQLRTMAEAERSVMLAYLIEMAFVECGDAIRARTDVPDQGPDLGAMWSDDPI